MFAKMHRPPVGWSLSLPLFCLGVFLMARPRSKGAREMLVIFSGASSGKLDLATDKFVRSAGACLIALAYSAHCLHHDSVPWVSPLTSLALIVHLFAQGATGVMAVVSPESQLKAMTSGSFSRTRLLNPSIRFFGVFSILVSLCSIFGHLKSIVTYHVLAAAHNGYSASCGLFPSHKKTLNHVAAAIVSAVALYYVDHIYTSHTPNFINNNN